MNSFRVFIVALVLMVVCGQLWAQEPSAIEQANQLEKRWCEYYLKASDQKEIARLNKSVADALSKAGNDGRFTDLKYQPTIGKGHGSGWDEHLKRTADMVHAWRHPGTKFHKDREVAAKATVAMDSYVPIPFDLNDDWGYGHTWGDLIESNLIGRVCLFARADAQTFPQEKIDQWAHRVPPIIFKRGDNFMRAGANLLWTAKGEIAACLTRTDEKERIETLDRYFRHIWNSMYERQGRSPRGEIPHLTVDNVLGEHAIPAMGAYGQWYLHDVIFFRDTLEGITRWQMPEDLNKLWIDVLLDGMAHVYQGTVDPHQCCAPTFWLNGRGGENETLRKWIDSFINCGYRADELKAVKDWQPGKTDWPFPDRSVKAFYTIECMTKHYPRHMASLRAISERTMGVETFAQKDLRRCTQSIFIPLGTCFLRSETTEFQDKEKKGIFDCLDYARLPGITTRYVDPETLADVWNRDAAGNAVRAVFSDVPYSGAVESPRTGVFGWWQARTLTVDRYNNHGNNPKQSDISVSGRRATFFLEDAIVHLGAGFDIRDEKAPTLTSLEQRLSAGRPITYAIGDRVQTLPAGGKISDDSIRWAWYEQVGYIPPKGLQTIQDVKQDYGQGEANNVFSMYTDHGRSDANLNFEWAVVPGIQEADMPGYVANRPWKILANTTSLQAVEVSAKRWIGAVFHNAGPLSSGNHKITVSRPAVVIVQYETDKATVFAADPFGKEGSLHIVVDGSSVKLEMPAGAHQGKTVTTTTSIRQAR